MWAQVMHCWRDPYGPYVVGDRLVGTPCMSSSSWCSFAVVTKHRKRGAYTLRTVNNGSEGGWRATAHPMVRVLEFAPVWDRLVGKPFHLSASGTSGRGHMFWKLWDAHKQYSVISDGLG